MIDLKRDVYEKLVECGVETVYFYPEDFKNLPVISYYEIENSDSGYCGSEVISDVSFQVDVWAEKALTVSEICMNVDEKMSGIGFRRAFAQDLNEDSVYRKTMRYSAKVNNVTLQMYKK
ncbi:MAG: hypothetical protein IJ583_13415 [Firmicutes bacterium]|nr:hypothetical protein [Bacillota bacterium]